MTVRYIDTETFDEVAGKDGQMLVVVKPSGGEEVVVREGADVVDPAVPPLQGVSQVRQMNAGSYYEICKDGWVWVCWKFICVKKWPAEQC